MLSFDVWVAEVVAIGAVVAILLISIAVAQLEALAQRSRTSFELLAAVFRETATLGLVALILFIIEETHAISDEAVNHEIALLHIAVWTIAIAYALWTAVLAYLSARLGRRWRVVERHYATNFDAYRELKLRVSSLQHKLGVASDAAVEEASLVSLVAHTVTHPVQWPAYLRALHDVRYIELRERFLAHHGLAHDFPFNKYLHSAKQHLFIRLANLPPAIWGGSAVVIGLDLFVRSAWPAYANGVEAVELVCILAGVMVLLSAVTYLKMRHVSFVIFRSEFAELQVEPALLEEAEGWTDIRTQMSYRAFGRREAVVVEEGGTEPGGPQRASSSSSSVASGRSLQRRRSSQRGDEAASASGEGVGRGLSLRMQSGVLDDPEVHRRLQRALLLKHRQLFWFKQPRFVLRLLQLVLFIAAADVALIVIFWREVTAGVRQVLFAFGSLVAAIFFCFAVLRAIVPLYSLSLHVSGLVDVRLLAVAVLAHEEAKAAVSRVAAAETGGAVSSGQPPPSSSSSLGGEEGGPDEEGGGGGGGITRRCRRWQASARRAWLASAASNPSRRACSAALYSHTGYLTALSITAAAFLLSAMITGSFIEGTERSVVLAFIAALTALVVVDWCARVWACGGLGARLLLGAAPVHTPVQPSPSQPPSRHHRRRGSAAAQPVASAFSMGSPPASARQAIARCCDTLAVAVAVVGVALAAAFGGFAPGSTGTGGVSAGGALAAPVYILAPAFLAHFIFLSFQYVANYGVAAAVAAAPQPAPAPSPAAAAAAPAAPPPRHPGLHLPETRLIRLIAEDAASARALLGAGAGPSQWRRGLPPSSLAAAGEAGEEVALDAPVLLPLTRQTSAPAAVRVPVSERRGTTIASAAAAGGVPASRLRPRLSLPARLEAAPPASPRQPPEAVLLQPETAAVLQDIEVAHARAEDVAIEAVLEEEEGGPSPRPSPSPGAAAAAAAGLIGGGSLSPSTAFGFGHSAVPTVGGLSIAGASAAAAAFLATAAAGGSGGSGGAGEEGRGGSGGGEGSSGGATAPTQLHPSLVSALHGIARGHLLSMMELPGEGWQHTEDMPLPPPAPSPSPPPPKQP